MFGRTGGDRRRVIASAVAALLLAGGTASIVVACSSQQTPPEVHSASKDAAQANQKGKVLPKSKPKSIAIPSIDVQSSLITLGLNKDKTVEVPQMGPDYDKAGWYRYSPTPGQRGPAVVLGHIDSAERGPSVFFKLSDVTKGETVKVTRTDGTVAIFTVDKIEQYPKSDFPTGKVYGNTQNAQLRLITCGGKFDESKDSYKDDIVVYAHLTGSHRA